MTVDMGVMIEGVAAAVVNQSHKRIRSTDDMQMKTTAVLAEQRTPIRYLVCHSAKSSCSNLHLLAAKSHPFSLKSTVLIGLISVRYIPKVQKNHNKSEKIRATVVNIRFIKISI